MGCSPCNGKDIKAKSNTIENDISDNSSAQPEIIINCAYEECIKNKETAKTPQVEMEVNEKNLTIQSIVVRRNKRKKHPQR